MSGTEGNGKRPNALVRLYRGETSYNFVGRRRWFYLASGLIILAGFISFTLKGFELNLGIDFKGGTSWTVKANGATVTDATKAVQAVGVTPSSVQTLGVGNSASIQVEADLNNLSSAQRTVAQNKVAQALADVTHTPVGNESIEFVGATWGSTVTDKAIEAMVVFFVLETAYIAVRFQWRMAIAALLKVIFHDLLITLAIFSLTDFQVTPDAVIAVLTIMGYSLYDTVVVFDKISENVKNLRGSRLTYLEIVNLSLNQVLARSINTSLVAIMPVLSVLVIGGLLLGATTLEQFGFPLLIGLVSGAYSSIFIAAPLRSDNEARDIKILAGRAGTAGSELLTPRAAALMLAGGSTSGGAKKSATTRAAARSGQTVRPGAAKSQRPAARTSSVAVADPDDTDDTDDADGGRGPSVAAAAAGAAVVAGAAKRPGPGARPARPSGNRPPPRPRKGGKGGGKGKKRR
jgi:preprotein translocase subunit SecF